MAVKKSRKPAAKKSTAKKPVTRKASAPTLTRDGGPQNWPTLSPYMVVRDAAASVRFYQAAFGFTVEGELMKDDQGVVQHASMKLGDASIMFGPHGLSPDMRPPISSGAVDGLSLYVYVPDVDALTARAERGGATILQRPTDQFWQDRTAAFRDIDGYHWTFATHFGA